MTGKHQEHMKGQDNFNISFYLFIFCNSISCLLSRRKKIKIKYTSNMEALNSHKRERGKKNFILNGWRRSSCLYIKKKKRKKKRGWGLTVEELTFYARQYGCFYVLQRDHARVFFCIYLNTHSGKLTLIISLILSVLVIEFLQFRLCHFSSIYISWWRQ